MFTRLITGLIMMAGAFIALTALQPVLNSFFTGVLATMNLNAFENFVLGLYKPAMLGIIFIGLFFYVVQGDRRNER